MIIDHYLKLYFNDNIKLIDNNILSINNISNIKYLQWSLLKIKLIIDNIKLIDNNIKLILNIKWFI